LLCLAPEVADGKEDGIVSSLAVSCVVFACVAGAGLLAMVAKVAEGYELFKKMK
jgi:hypothetical protein